ncbi:MAG: cobalamin B12-binding domain-containing protein [Alphaproteobacteria bacterium]|nr:cobalamin B12-binding domain-containing protein [Alphaproteobacteria bacterium]MDP6814121.1 cobalamin B12-binding domain-containing protein [Alphaproteobacteria bacterium]
MATDDRTAGPAARILLAKVGFDGHDRGVKVLAAAFRDAGHEVIYLGKYLTVAAVVQAAIQESAEVIGLSFLGGAHLTYCRELMELIAEEGLDDRLVIAGGVIPRKDFPALTEMGIAGIFDTNTRTGDILDFLDRSLAGTAGA